jgi:hypothetical protein
VFQEKKKQKSDNIITIIIGKAALLDSEPSLMIMPYLASGLHFFSQQYFFYTARSSALRPTPNLENQVFVCMSPSERVVQLYHQALGSFIVTFDDSQGYGGGILTRLHTGYSRLPLMDVN